jgi:hypothetical protein
VSWLKRSSRAEPAPAATAEAADAGHPQVEPLTDDEIEWVQSTIAGLDEQGVRRDDIDDLGRHYDELLTGWLRMRDEDRPDPDRVISQIGLAFGQHIADHTGLAWGVATGAHGPEIALHRPRAVGRVLLYPAGMVAERWAARETGMLPALARATIEAVRDIPDRP